MITPHTPEYEQLYKHAKSWLFSSMELIIIELKERKVRKRKKNEFLI